MLRREYMREYNARPGVKAARRARAEQLRAAADYLEKAT